MKNLSSLGCVLSFFLIFVFFSLNGQDPQVEQLYKAWVSKTTEVNSYKLSGQLRELRDSSIILAPTRTALVELPIDRIGKLRFVPEKKPGRGMAILIGIGVGGLTANLLTKAEWFGNSFEQMIYGKLGVVTAGAILGGIIGNKIVAPKIKIRLNGNYDTYQKRRIELEKFIR